MDRRGNGRKGGKSLNTKKARFKDKNGSNSGGLVGGQTLVPQAIGSILSARGRGREMETKQRARAERQTQKLSATDLEIRMRCD